MRRVPNISISGWFRQNGFGERPWVINASCGERQELPWIGDSRPSPGEHGAMMMVCNECPVIGKCAAYGLTTAGGFYAGVWLPWKSTSTESVDARLIRNRGRTVLRRIAHIESRRLTV